MQRCNDKVLIKFVKVHFRLYVQFCTVYLQFDKTLELTCQPRGSSGHLAKSSYAATNGG